MPGAHKLISPVDQDYADHMDLIAVKYDPGIALGLGVVVDIDKAKDQAGYVIIDLLTIIIPHGVSPLIRMQML